MNRILLGVLVAGAACAAGSAWADEPAKPNDAAKARPPPARGDWTG